MTTISRPETTAPAHAPQRNRWLAWLSVVLLIVGLAASFFIGRGTVPDQTMPADLASSQLKAFLNQQAEAFNSGDATRLRPFYAADATMTDIGNIYAKPIKGGDEIATAMQKNVELLGPFAGDVGTPIARGNFVAYVSSWGDVTAGVIVFELDAEGKILNQWVIHTAQ